MNKTELINKVAETTSLSKKDVETVIKATLETIMETTAAGEKIQIVGFGTFETRERAERLGRNPRTKEEIIIPASKVPAFKPGKEYKERTNA